MYIEKLAGVNSINYIGGKEEIAEKVSNAVAEDTELYIPLGELIDFDKEAARLNKEIGKAETEIQRGERMLSNPGFLSKAPAKLVEEERQKLMANKQLLNKLKEQLEYIGKG